MAVEDLVTQLVTFFPWYVFLVLLPLGLRMVVERAFGIRHEVFKLPPPSGMAYETVFRGIVLEALYYPFFEELVFRGAPLYLFGYWGLVIGSAIWVLMHPAWQLLYLADHPTWKKVLYTITSTFYYACNAVFYGMMWLAGAGVAAIIYHAGHNLWLTLMEIFQEVELPAPWKKPKFVLRAEGRRVGQRPSMRFVQRKSAGIEGELPGGGPSFVRRKLKNME